MLTEADSWRNGVIARADVADFLLKAVEDPAWIGKTPVLVTCPL